MAKIDVGQSPSTGEWFARLPGNRVEQITEEQANQIMSGEGAVTTAVKSAGNMIQQLGLGAATLLPDVGNNAYNQDRLTQLRQEQRPRDIVSPVSSLVGQAVPMVAADAGALALGGVPLAIGAGAALGAAAAPETPWEGAAIGGAFGALPAVAPAARGAVSAVRGGPERMADRVLGRLKNVEDANAAAFADNQRLAGLFSPDEAGAMNLPLTTGDARLLAARNAGDEQTARQLRRMEETRRTDPIFGADIEQTRQAQKNWLTDYTKTQIGVEGPQTLTPATIGESLSRLGVGFDNIGRQVDRVDSYEVIGGFDQALRNATGDHAAALRKIADRADAMAQGGEGSITGEQLMQLRSDLGKQVRAGQGQGNYAKVYDANEMITAIDNAISSQAGAEVKAAYDALRRQYSIVKKLMKPGVVNAEGQINAASFRNALLGSRNTTFKDAGNDPLTRAAVTAALLEQRVIGSSGTAERLLANPGRAAVRLGGGAALGAAGLGGGASLLN
jgi:hypothetical protein